MLHVPELAITAADVIELAQGELVIVVQLPAEAPEGAEAVAIDHLHGRDADGEEALFVERQGQPGALAIGEEQADLGFPLIGEPELHAGIGADPA